MSRIIDIIAGLLLGVVIVFAFELLTPILVTASTKSKPNCSPMFELDGADGVFGCIHGTGLNGTFQFEPCTGPTIKVPVSRVKTTAFTCNDEASE